MENLALLIVVAPPFALGALRPSLWTFAAGPLAGLAIGALMVASEPPEFDQHGFGWGFGLVIALVAAAAWTLGWVVGASWRWVEAASEQRRTRPR